MADDVTIKGVEISSPDKVLFPDPGITKRELAEYYAEMADRMLPFLKDRALTMQRFPDGIGEDGFYQKEAGDYFPDFVQTVRIANRSESGETNYPVCRNVKSLVYLAQIACITPHAWLSRRDQPDIPDRIIFDLDPPSGEDFDLVVDAARILRPILENAGLTPFIMTTGSKGLHVVTPIRRELDFDAVREKAKQFTKEAAEEAPDRLTTEIRKNKRKGRLFLDIARNAYGQTGVAPYAVRARPQAPVATPLAWEELDDRELRADRYTLRSISDRLAQTEDPWKGMQRHAASLKE